MSKEGNPDAIVFPKAKLEDPYDFSFSGVKSAVLNHINRCKMQGEEICEADIAASFRSSGGYLVEKAVKAAKSIIWINLPLQVELRPTAPCARR